MNKIKKCEQYPMQNLEGKYVIYEHEFPIQLKCEKCGKTAWSSVYFTNHIPDPKLAFWYEFGTQKNQRGKCWWRCDCGESMTVIQKKYPICLPQNNFQSYSELAAFLKEQEKEIETILQEENWSVYRIGQQYILVDVEDDGKFSEVIPGIIYYYDCNTPDNLVEENISKIESICDYCGERVTDHDIEFWGFNALGRDLDKDTIVLTNSNKQEQLEETRYVVEWCPHCDREIELKVDAIEQNYQIYCPYCGKKIMLCDACMHADDNLCQKCDWYNEHCFREKK